MGAGLRHQWHQQEAAREEAACGWQRGVFRGAPECFRLLPGFYSLAQILVLLAARARARVKTLAQDWMAEQPEAAGFLYVDGHVRVYHGVQTKLPRR